MESNNAISIINDRLQHINDEEFEQALKKSIDSLSKDIPVKPNHTLIKYGKHKWRLNEDGEVDTFAWDYEYHNGVVCERCYATVCVHCNPDYDKLTDCEEKYYTCPVCNHKISSAHNRCSNCNKMIDWSK